MSIDAALVLHQQGNWAKAEHLYHQVLRDQPGDAEALHLLGVLCLQAGQPQRAVEWIGQSLRSNPQQPAAHLNLGVALQSLDRLPEALSCCECALLLAPEYPEALNNRGDILLALQRPAEALQSLQRAVELQPNFPLGLNNLGNALRALGRLDDALASYERALQLEPNLVRALNNRGNALRDLKRLEEALGSFEQAVRVDPDYGPALYNQGTALLELKRCDDALVSFERLLRRNPDDADALTLQGIAQIELELPEQALASLDKALALSPDLVPALINRGIVLASLRRFEQAVHSFGRALLLDPENPHIHYNRAEALRAMERFDVALLDYQQALHLDPNLPHALFSGAMTMIRLRRHREAVGYFQKLRELEPDYPYTLGAEFLARSQICDWADAERRRLELIGEVLRGAPAATPLGFLAATGSAADQLLCARANTRDRYPASGDVRHAAARYRHERIRLAYVSGDLRNHAVAHLIVGLIERHDRQRFEINAVSFKPPQAGGIAKRVHDAFDRFVDVGGRSDADIAAAIRSMEIDIAIDLAGYTEGNRLGIFAHRAAPVQAAFLGFAGTTGAPYMDYLVADEVVIPAGEERWYAEQVVRLPHCYLPNDDEREIAAPPTKAEAGLPAEGFVFCAFTNAYKINPPIFDVWMRLLSEVPGSVLWLRATGADARDNLRREARQRGVEPERLVFAPHVEGMPQHLARQSLADLYLDTLPYNAHSTACDALWAGVPVLSCPGQCFAGRVAASALTAVGLTELIADSPEAYERKALELARHPGQLQSLRRQLQQSRAAAPLFDTVAFTRHLEIAYETMHEQALRGRPPFGFSVEPLSL